MSTRDLLANRATSSGRTTAPRGSYAHDRINRLVGAHNRLLEAHNGSVDYAQRLRDQVRDALHAERARSRTLAEALYVVLGRVQYLERQVDALVGATDDEDEELTVSPWVAQWQATRDPDEADAILEANLPPADPDPIAAKIWSVAA